MNENTSY